MKINLRALTITIVILFVLGAIIGFNEAQAYGETRTCCTSSGQCIVTTRYCKYPYSWER